MKKYIFILMMMVMAMPSIVCAKSNEKSTAVFTVNPQMTCQNCENKIKSNLRFEKGVSAIVTDLKGQTVTVTYDASKTDKSKLVSAFRKIGYNATEASAAVAPAQCHAVGKKCCGNAAKCAPVEKKCAASKTCQTQNCQSQAKPQQVCDKPANCCNVK